MPDSSGGGGNTGGGGGTGASLSGTYYYDDYYNSDWYITFRSDGSFTAYDGYTTRGSYTVSGSRLRLSVDFCGTNWTIVDSNTLMDGDGDYWEK